MITGRYIARYMAAVVEEKGKTGLEESVPDLGKDSALGSQNTASEHLRKVLQSETLRSSPMLRRLLEYIGTRSLDGRGSELKEFTIGVEALDRSDDFDRRPRVSRRRWSVNARLKMTPLKMVRMKKPRGCSAVLPVGLALFYQCAQAFLRILETVKLIQENVH